MNTMGMGLAPILFGIHILASVAFFTGILLLVLWAHKHLTATQLKQYGLALVIGGAIVCLLTVGITGRGMLNYGKTGMNVEHRGMGMMMDDDDDDSMGMSMNGMTTMLEGKTGDDFDKAFLQMMIPHHQGAIDMAILAQQSAGHREIKVMANDIITAQQREIDQMHAWQNSWGFTK